MLGKYKCWWKNIECLTFWTPWKHFFWYNYIFFSKQTVVGISNVFIKKLFFTTLPDILYICSTMMFHQRKCISLKVSTVMKSFLNKSWRVLRETPNADLSPVAFWVPTQYLCIMIRPFLMYYGVPLSFSCRLCTFEVRIIFYWLVFVFIVFASSMEL